MGRRKREGIVRHSVPELAAKLNCDVSDIYSRIREGELDIVKSGAVVHVLLPQTVPQAQRSMYEALWEAMASVMVEYDPEGLVGAGRGSSAYDLEISTILPRMSAARGTDDVNEILREEFEYWFGPSRARSDSWDRSLADRVWEVWSTSAWRTGRRSGE